MNKYDMLGTTKYKGHKYTAEDIRGLINPESLGLVDFYGGRVKRLGKTNIVGLYLCLEGTEVIDLIQFYDGKPIPAEEVVDEPEDIIEEDPVPNEPPERAQIIVEKPKAKSLPRKKKK